MTTEYYNREDPDTITIPIKEYNELKNAALMLSYLEAGGVDNWEWYGESLQGYWEEIGEDED